MPEIFLKAVFRFTLNIKFVWAGRKFYCVVETQMPNLGFNISVQI